MKRCPQLVLSFLVALAAAPAWAADVFQCEDDKGNRTFESHCPPGTKPVDQRSYSADGGPAPESARATVTVYLVPNCDSCDQVKEFLSVRNIRPIEKNVADDIKLQEELKSRAGDLRVPVTIIGDRVINGYNRSEMLAALESGGYGEGAGEGGETAAEGEAEEEATEEEVALPEEEAVEEETAAEEPAEEEAPEEETEAE
jgi:glutaredoxin